MPGESRKIFDVIRRADRFNPLPAIMPGESREDLQPLLQPEVSIHSRQLCRENLNTRNLNIQPLVVSIHSRQLCRENL